MFWKLGGAACTLLLLVACQDPFGSDRHDLLGDRVISLAAPLADSDDVVPVLWLLEGGQLGADASEVEWFWLPPSPSPDQLLTEPALASGLFPILSMPSEDKVLGVRVTFPSQQVRTAWVAPRPQSMAQRPQFSLRAVEAPAPSQSGPEDLSVEARRAAQSNAAEFLPVDRWGRIEVSPLPSTSTLRWMQQGTPGTFLELDDNTTDWASARLTLDDLEVEEAVPTPKGPVTIAALAIDAERGNALWLTELWVGAPSLGFYAQGRWITTSEDVNGPFIRGTLTRAPERPSQILLEDPEGLSAQDLPDLDPFDTEGLDCLLTTSGPFDPQWIVEGRCPWTVLEGRRVVFEVDAQ